MRVCDLIERNFSKKEIVELKRSGRPTPILSIVQLQKGCKSRAAFVRKFDRNVYDKTSWVCGCDEKNALFCFVCLLFGGDDSWTKSGVVDLKHLSDKIKKHENSSMHKDNLVSFQLIDRANGSSSDTEKATVHLHNEKVKKNRLVLSRIIDILKLCGKCDLSLVGYNGSSTKGMFRDLVDFSRKIDPVLDKHLSDPDVFRITSQATLNELLQFMLEVCRDNIVQEIKNCPFLAVMADDTTNISTQTQMALAFRYELKASIFERFWGFFNHEGEIAACILRQLDPMLRIHPGKLIAQTYDGTVDLPIHEMKIKERYRVAYFIHCYAHQFDELFEQAVSTIPSVRIFFLNLRGIASFFSNSLEKIEALSDNKTLPQSSWSSHSKIVQTIFAYKDDIYTCFSNIGMGQPRKYNSELTLQAAGFAKWLEDDAFVFWLSFFGEILPHLEVLNSQLQKIEMEPEKFQVALECVEKAIDSIRSDLTPVEDVKPPIIGIKRRRFDNEDLQSSAKKVCDIIIQQIQERFKFQDHLSGARLFLKKNYPNYRESLPLDDIDQFCNAFSAIDTDILKTELRIFYSRPELAENPTISGCLETLESILWLGLEEAFKEIIKVLQILLTIPMPSTEPRRCISKLSLIKSFLNNPVCGDHLNLNALGMISMESAMVQEIPDFNEKVIEKFIADKSRKMEFHFKQ